MHHGRMSEIKGHMMFGKVLMSHAEELGLTDYQLDQLKDIWMEFKKSKIRIKSEMEIAHIEMAQMLMQEEVDMAAVESQIKKIQQMRGELMLEKTKTMLKGREILTPEQRTMFKVLMMKAFTGMHQCSCG